MARRKNHHPIQDFFVADVFDNLPFKSDMATMEHPIFVLSKNKDMRCLEYQKDNVAISIIPNAFGLPTIFDKDILLYCGSQLMQEINAGRIPPKTLRISSHDLLVATNRPTDGRGYRLLKKALDRLVGVKIKTNIRTNKREQTSSFGMIDSYDVIESSRVKDRMVRLEITLSDWFYNSLLGKEVLKINRDYFQLAKPLERRLYEIARKHCGYQQHWSIGLIPLMAKTGSTSPLRKFRFFIKQIMADNDLPDYAIALDDDDKVTFSQKNAVDTAQPQLSFDTLPDISSKTIDTARDMVLQSATGLDFYAIHAEFSESLAEGFAPDNANAAFIGFVKKKIADAHANF